VKPSKKGLTGSKLAVALGLLGVIGAAPALSRFLSTPQRKERAGKSGPADVPHVAVKQPTPEEDMLGYLKLSVEKHRLKSEVTFRIAMYLKKEQRKDMQAYLLERFPAKRSSFRFVGRDGGVLLAEFNGPEWASSISKVDFGEVLKIDDFRRVVYVDIGAASDGSSNENLVEPAAP